MIQEIGYCTGIENYSRHLTGRPPASRRRPSSTTSRRTSCSSSTRATSPSPSSRHVPGRPLPQGHPRRVRFPAALGPGQPAAPLRGVRGRSPRSSTSRPPRRTTRLERPRAWWWSRSSGPPVSWTRRSRCARPAPGRRPARRDPPARAAGERVLVTTLTKRMAEDLTDYYADWASGCATSTPTSRPSSGWRSSATCAWADFDVLVGINLLREGLDIPEVSLVAILDADKEGFLRSERSLIQTCGRAARNVERHGDHVRRQRHRSMQQAIDETGRRRTIQEDYNRGTASPRRASRRPSPRPSDSSREANPPRWPWWRSRSANTLCRRHRRADPRIGKDMRAAAKELDFEHAVELRDRIKVLRQVPSGNGLNDRE